jgi:hypothetical protein
MYPFSLTPARTISMGVKMKKIARREKSEPPSSATQEQGLVALSCPDCFGVLHYEREGPNGHLLYRCQVDHRYTLNSLIEGKETQVERTLWSAVLLLTQLGYAYQDLLGEMKRSRLAGRKQMRRRVQEVRRQGVAIRAMIEATHAVE